MKNRRGGKWIAIGLTALIVTGFTVFPAEVLTPDPAENIPAAVRSAQDSVVSAGDEIRQEIRAKDPAAPAEIPAASRTETAFAGDTAAPEIKADAADPTDLDDASGLIEPADPSEYTNNEIYVTYTDGTDEVRTCRDSRDVSENLAMLAGEENVAYVQPNYTYTLAEAPDDPFFGKQWGLYNDGSFEMDNKQPHPEYDNPLGLNPEDPQPQEPESQALAGRDINYLEAAGIFNDFDREIIIALIDTGADYTHPDLQETFWVNGGEIPGNRKDDDGNGYTDDVYGWNFYGNNNRVLASGQEVHGTHVAGILAAASGNGRGITGASLNPKVKVMILKVLGGSDGNGSTASIVSAIRYAQANGASICNLSLCSDANDHALYRAIAGSSMLFITASGNTGSDIDKTPSYPASYDLDNIIAVANMSADGNLEVTSNYGVNSVDIAAPGTDILSTIPGGAYGFMTGTSMATPMVAAAAATVYSHYEDITVDDIPGILLTTARVTDELMGRVSTGGMLDMKAALSLDKELIQEAAANRKKSGSSPEIYTQTTTRMGRDYLVVKVRDMDGDLTQTVYSPGNLTPPEFLGGTVGKSFRLNALGIHVFAIKAGGTYTFYAADESGNETIKAVAL
ncbi:MAG: S8 family serine peptidase [Firmicutes bacterium]|nr:S8 family serine peptidase [Bacillota bacterium]